MKSYSTALRKVLLCSIAAGISGLASHEQARRVPDAGGEEVADGGGEGSTRQEVEGELQFHSYLTLMEHTFASLKVHM